MTYRTYRRSRPSSAGPGRWMDLRRPGTCLTCKEEIPAGERAYWDPRDRATIHHKIACAEPAGLTEQVWKGAPGSGAFIPTFAATRTLRDTDGTALAMTRYGLRRGYEHTGQRCEDAPCCGCC